MMGKIYLTFGMVTIMATTTPVLSAQSTTPTDSVLAALQLQQQRLEAQQAIMDARLKIQQDQQNLLMGALPASSATPMSGTFTVSGNTPFPSQKLAYDELLVIAENIAAKATSPGPFIIYDQAEINSLANYQAATKVLSSMQTQVASLEDALNNKLKPHAERLLKLEPVGERFAPILIPGLVLGGLKTASDIIGMFRTDTTIAYSTFTADDAALAAAVAAALLGAGKKVYQPAATPPNLTDGSSSFIDQWFSMQALSSKLVQQASLYQAQLQQLSDALGAYIQADQPCQANQDLIAAEQDPIRKESLKTKQKSLDRAREVARQYLLRLFNAPVGAELDPAKANIMKAERDAFLKILAGFVTSATTTATALSTLQAALTSVSSSGSVALTPILRAERLMSVLTGNTEASILLVKTSVLGGSVVTRTNLFTGGHLLFTGGAIANFTLFDAAGSIKVSGVVVGSSKTDKVDY